MSRMKVVLAVGVALIFCAGIVWSADQDQSIDRIGQHLQTQDRLQDGSCQEEETAYEVAAPVQSQVRLKDCTDDGEPDRDRDRDQLRDGPCDGEPDKEPLRIKDQLKDGSCQD